VSKKAGKAGEEDDRCPEPSMTLKKSCAEKRGKDRLKGKALRGETVQGD